MDSRIITEHKKAAEMKLVHALTGYSLLGHRTNEHIRNKLKNK